MKNSITNELSKIIIGHNDLIEAMIITTLCEGHLYIQGPPGVAKTTAVKALAQVLGLEFKRIQFTPDLLPSDITGSEIFDIKSNHFRVKKGPIFTNLLLADEINRAGAKVQSALLEAMAESQVSIGDTTYKLPYPFVVLATANPMESEGVYRLPEASMDRFMMKISVNYNTFLEEKEIILTQSQRKSIRLKQILDLSMLEKFKSEIESIYFEDELVDYMLSIVFATREPQKYGIDELADMIDYGAGTRGSIDMYKISSAYAWLYGRDYVLPSDIAKASYKVLAHRVTPSVKASIKGIDSYKIIQTILDRLPVP